MAGKKRTTADARTPTAASECDYKLALATEDGVEVAKTMIAMMLVAGTDEDEGLCAFTPGERDTYLHHIDEILREAHDNAHAVSAVVHGAWIRAGGAND